MVGLGTPFAKLHWQENITPTNDRVLLLSGKDGIKANKLHAKTEGALWYVHFEDGRLPEPLKQRWTKYSTLLKAVKEYYALKNIEITEE
jgi:hypothetical protein